MGRHRVSTARHVTCGLREAKTSLYGWHAPPCHCSQASPCHCWHNPCALGSVLSTVVSKQLDNLGIIQKRTETRTKKKKTREWDITRISPSNEREDVLETKHRGTRKVHFHSQAWWSQEKNKGISHWDRTTMILTIEPSKGAHTQRSLSLRQVLTVLLDVFQNPIAWQMLGVPQQPCTCWSWVV